MNQCSSAVTCVCLVSSSVMRMLPYSILGALAAASQDHQENQQALRKEGILRVLLTICNSESSAERMRDKATAIMISIVGQPDTSEQQQITQ